MILWLSFSFNLSTTNHKKAGGPKTARPAHEGNFPAYMAKVQGSLLLSPFGVTTER